VHDDVVAHASGGRGQLAGFVECLGSGTTPQQSTAQISHALKVSGLGGSGNASELGKQVDRAEGAP
jgi:hypothetical protein